MVNRNYDAVYHAAYNVTHREERKAYKADYYVAHREEVKTRSAAYYAAHQEEGKSKSAAYYAANREEGKTKRAAYYAAHREEKKTYDVTYRAEHQKEINALRKVRRRIDNQFRIACNLRSRITKAVRDGQKAGSAVRDLGMSIPEFEVHIESLFTSGMSWKNYGKWHLDHITPLTSFDLTDREQFLKAAHWSNYQPLWAEENARKGDRLNWSEGGI